MTNGLTGKQTAAEHKNNTRFFLNLLHLFNH